MPNKNSLALALLVMAQVLTFVAAVDYPPRIIIPLNATYGNLAWGFSGGGKDTVAGKQVLLVDLDEVTASQISDWKAQGHIVQCYFSVGTAEKWRKDFDSSKWDPLALGTLPQFQEEYWLDLSQLSAIKTLMTPRFYRAQQLGCDALEPDNTDCYDNAECNNPLKKKVPGINVKAKQIEYCRWQVETAHQLGMSISLKNSLDIIPDLVDIYDFAVNEQCHEYSECAVYAPFISQGKPVFNHEYILGSGNSYCTTSASLKLQTKRCAGSGEQGICFKTSTWQNCFGGLATLPPRQFTSGIGTIPPFSSAPTSAKPSKSPTRAPTKRPTTSKPTKRPSTLRPTKTPTRRPTRRPTTSFPSKRPTSFPTRR